MIVCIRVPSDALPDTAWQELLDALDAVTPLIEDARVGDRSGRTYRAFLDMHGADGDFMAWSRMIRALLVPLHQCVRIGAGPNRFCAFAAAWCGDGTVIAAGEEAATLTPMPLDVLELEADVVQRLQLLGITTLGALAGLPHGPFVRRFGPDAARWHDAARGIDRAPFVPRGHAITIEAALLGEGSAQSEAAVIFALRVLLGRICTDLERCGKRASALQVEIELENADTVHVDVQLAAATSQERAMLDVLRAKLEGASFPAPICGLRLRAMGLEEGGEAVPLLAGDEIDRANVAVVLARLEAMLGEPVRRAQTCAAHPLEERFRYEPFALPKRDPAGRAAESTPKLVPQLRLLAVTEIDVRLRRGEPATVGGRTVRHVTGPWRIEEGWFASQNVTRDEYDVQLDNGEICRIYRQGDRWYLRGSYD
jgi:protein ImuB